MSPVVEERIVLSADDLAHRLGVSVRHVRRMDVAGKLPQPVRIGGCVRWPVDKIDAWIRANCPNRRVFEAMWNGA